MGASSSEYVEFVIEQLTSIAGVGRGRFFGGTALSAGGVQFAMIMDNALYFAVDDSTRPVYQQMGSRCFSYQTRKGRVEVKRYYEVPGDLLDDQDRLVLMAKESIRVVQRAKGRRQQSV